MSEKAHSALIEWKLVKDCMTNDRFKGKFCNISPTSSADDREKFYAEIQLLTTSLSKGDMVIIEVDCNAHRSA
ncbi:unnamed protein product [Dracunculus medinensis]|uniref:DUF559 domain-containing protein n=1 Tax=Dracunculus medinensis TaxID=318479 RepID=A0A0N4U119_DRAME|nr:unnamed protein product [Dracunculus medinensis]